MEKSEQLHPIVRGPGTHKTGIWSLDAVVKRNASTPAQNPIPFLQFFSPQCSYYLLLVFNPWASFWQESEPSQATGMALVRCILGKFLGVVCHCFPPYIYIYTHMCVNE